MHRALIVIALLAASCGAHALQSLRVGGRVLVVGDSAARVRDLLGEPSVRKGSTGDKGKARARPASARGKKAKARDGGELWQYRREGRLITFTLVDGCIVRIDDVAR